MAHRMRFKFLYNNLYPRHIVYYSDCRYSEIYEINGLELEDKKIHTRINNIMKNRSKKTEQQHNIPFVKDFLLVGGWRNGWRGIKINKPLIFPHIYDLSNPTDIAYNLITWGWRWVEQSIRIITTQHNTKESQTRRDDITHIEHMNHKHNLIKIIFHFVAIHLCLWNLYVRNSWVADEILYHWYSVAIL